MENVEDTCGDAEETVRRHNTYIIGVPKAEEKENGTEATQTIPKTYENHQNNIRKPSTSQEGFLKKCIKKYKNKQW